MIVRFDKTKKEWIQIAKEKRIPTDLYIDGKLKSCLDHFKKLIQKEDDDIVVIISGKEGSGKSTLMANILEYISDSHFDPVADLVGSDYLDGLNKIENAKQKGWLGFDEGNSFFLASETVKREHRDLHKIFSIFRQKNLFVAICLPGFLRLGTYFALDRSKVLIRTYKKKGKKSFFAFYGEESKNKLYRLGKPTWNDNFIRPNFRGRFLKNIKLENEEYKAFKKVTLVDEIGKAKKNFEKPKTEVQIRREVIREIVLKNKDRPRNLMGEILGYTHGRMSQIIKESEPKSLLAHRFSGK
jgi:hypothetical protein